MLSITDNICIKAQKLYLRNSKSTDLLSFCFNKNIYKTPSSQKNVKAILSVEILRQYLASNYTADKSLYLIHSSLPSLEFSALLEVIHSASSIYFTSDTASLHACLHTNLRNHFRLMYVTLTVSKHFICPSIFVIYNTFVYFFSEKLQVIRSKKLVFFFLNWKICC